MSDTQQGPEWWLASDGKWYPPQSRPLPPPPPAPVATYPPPASGPMPTHRVLSGWLQGLLWVSAAASALTAIFAIQAISAASEWWNDDVSAINDWITAEDAYTTLNGLFSLVSIAVFVLLIIWTYRIHGVSSRLWPHHRQWSRGWTIGGWFIPLANFIIVPLLLQEIWRILRSPHGDTAARGDWRSTPADGLITGWWILYAVGVVLTNGFSIANSDDDLTDIGDYTTPMWIGVVGQVLVVAGVVCAVLFIRRVTTRLHDIARPG